MKTARLAFALVLATPGLALAQEVAADTDGDGLLSWEEVQAAYPDVTEEAFVASDTDGSGALDEAELAAAYEAGTIPMAM